MTSLLPARSTSSAAVPLGWWVPGDEPAERGPEALLDALRDVDSALMAVDDADGTAVARGGSFVAGDARPAPDAVRVRAHVPALRPERLGSAAFRGAHGVRYAYVAGAMANGIASTRLVEAMSRAGMLACFGAAGLDVATVDAAMVRLGAELGDGPWGSNLIHSPSEKGLEDAVVDVYLRRQVRTVSASAYMGLTLPLVRYRTAGIRALADGRVHAPNRVLAKVSRVEVARQFFAPPPAAMLDQLVRSGALTRDQAELAERLPVAADLTAEADSGGHTDNRPALTLVPMMLELAERATAEHGFETPLRVGAAGGICTPQTVAAAFAMGADYVLTGSINQACVESGSSDRVRQMLAEAGQADVCMAPAADMFEMGVKVQVLKRGTLFPMRATRLFELYRSRAGLDDLSAAERSDLEKKVFRQGLDQVWQDCVAYFAQRDPAQITRAEEDPKHRLALVFRWYLGRSSHWANRGEQGRQVDYQVWCGPSMGAFNQWCEGSDLADARNRGVVTVARNLLLGAAVRTRAHLLRAQGVALPATASLDRPLTAAELEERLL